jgi:hypothetical protein
MSRSELTTTLGLALERSTEAYRYARLHEAPDEDETAEPSAAPPAGPDADAPGNPQRR